MLKLTERSAALADAAAFGAPTAFGVRSCAPSEPAGDKSRLAIESVALPLTALPVIAVGARRPHA